MPQRDGTGPKGQGPKTGRGQGKCGSGGTKTPDKTTPKEPKQPKKP